MRENSKKTFASRLSMILKLPNLFLIVRRDIDYFLKTIYFVVEFTLERLNLNEETRSFFRMFRQELHKFRVHDHTSLQIVECIQKIKH